MVRRGGGGQPMWIIWGLPVAGGAIAYAAREPAKWFW
jgi:hypothetical protein